MEGSSFKHGTDEGVRRCKPMCARCLAHKNGEPVEASTNPIPVIRDVSPPQESVPLSVLAASAPDIIQFLAAGRFHEINVSRMHDDSYAVEIRANGDKFVGFAPRADYAFHQAIKRYLNTDPETGPVTLTFDQTTGEGSHTKPMESTGREVPLEDIWEGHGKGEGNSSHSVQPRNHFEAYENQGKHQDAIGAESPKI